MNNVTDVVYYENEIWATTSGGAYRFNIPDSSAQKYTNLDGLTSIELSAISYDDNGNIIVASTDGHISIYNSSLRSFKLIKDISENKKNDIGNITDIYINNDTLWIAADKGVGVFLYRNMMYEFRDFFKDQLHLPIIPEKSTKILCFNNQVFYATKNGLLYAPPNFIKSPENWKIYSTENILPNNDVRTLAVINDTLYIGTANGAVRLSKDGWYDNAFNWSSGVVNNITVVNNTLHFFRDGDFYILNSGIWERVKGYGIFIQSIDKDDDENLWLGLRDGGLMNWKWNDAFLMDGPASNFIGIVTKDNKGSLWMTSGKFKVYYTKGFYQYNFNNWTNYRFYDNKWNWKNSTDAVYADRIGNVWFGAWGGGVTMLSDTGIIFFHNWPDSGRLIISDSDSKYEYKYGGISDDYKNCFPPTSIQNGTYCVVTDFIEDIDGNLWAGIHSSENSNYILAIPRNSNNTLDITCDNWIYFGNNVGMGAGEGEVSLMDFDDYGRLWFGTFQAGIVILDYNQTLINSTDDQIIKVGIEDGLYSNTVLSVQKDHDGVMWIGTAAGLNSYDGQNFYKHIGDTGPIENKINYIFVDDYNNKWFATDGGLSILEGDKSPWDANGWRHFTTENSGLVNGIVNSVFVDSDKGEAYIGTDLGLSIFRGAFSEIKPNFDKLTGGPNPFFIDDNANIFTIKNLMVNSTVKILNINGKLVRILSEENGLVEGSRATWDGRDSNNKIVASGIYIYLIYSEEGVIGKGKLSVIRK
jgi:ligand-binding sensor domain-containing protein